MFSAMYILLYTAFLARILDVTIIMIIFLATPEYILVIKVETSLNIEAATAAAAHAITFAVVDL